MTNYQELAQHFHLSSLKNVADLFGIQNVISLLIIRKAIIEGSPVLEWRKLENLIWIETPPKTYSVAGIEVRENQYKILGVPNNLDFIDWFQSTGVSYWVNAELREFEVYDGFEVEFITIEMNEPLCFNLTVRRKPDNRHLR